MILFDESMQFFKGNTHMHTTQSDGKLSPEDAAALYRSMGYDFVVQTDHWKVAPERMDNGLLVMSGTEFDVYPPNQTAHIVGIGVSPAVHDQGFSKESEAQPIIDAINADGGCAILAHPAWSLNTPQYISSLKGLTATEIFNTFSGNPWNSDRSDSSSLLDVTATNGCLLPLVAADDSHHYTGEAGRSYVMVQAEKCTSESILAALKTGRFYATQGPRFHYVEVLEDRILIRCSPAARITFYSNLPWVGGRCRNGVGMKEAEYIFQRERKESYVRCEITDAYGAKAWLSPIKIEY